MLVTSDSIQHTYIQDFPTEVPVKAAQGFIATAAISLVTGSACSVALLGGSLAVISTLIEAITRPIIRAIFRENRLIPVFIQIVIPKMVTFSLAAAIAPWIGISYTVTSLIIPFIAWIALNDRFYEKNVGMVEVF